MYDESILVDAPSPLWWLGVRTDTEVDEIHVHIMQTYLDPQSGNEASKHEWRYTIRRHSGGAGHDHIERDIFVSCDDLAVGLAEALEGQEMGQDAALDLAHEVLRQIKSLCEQPSDPHKRRA